MKNHKLWSNKWDAQCYFAVLGWQAADLSLRRGISRFLGSGKEAVAKRKGGKDDMLNVVTNLHVLSWSFASLSLLPGPAGGKVVGLSRQRMMGGRKRSGDVDSPGLSLGGKPGSPHT